jgi:hypothetical protein
LTHEDIRAALAYAADVLAHETIVLQTAPESCHVAMARGRMGGCDFTIEESNDGFRLWTGMAG